MKKYLLPKEGNFYKANLHCHSNISDGNLSPLQLKELYKSHGYSVLAYTDHDIFLPHHNLTDENFLALAGFEAELNENGQYPTGKDVPSTHICFIAKDTDMDIQPCWHEKYAYIGGAVQYKDKVKYDKNEAPYERNRTPECVNTMIKKARDAGFFVTYNHPFWSLDNYENYSKYEGMHAMEIFNSECAALGYDSYAPNVYDDILKLGRRIYAVSADDNHNKAPVDHLKCGSFGGFVMIKAQKLEYNAITDALFKGNFYASQGPEIHDLYIEDGKICVNCSDVETITLATGRRAAQIACGKIGETVNHAEFAFAKEDVYLRITATDKNGKHANTSAYFIDEL